MSESSGSARTVAGRVHRRAALFRDPPLVDRITWREGLFPRALISEDRGLIARTFGTLYAVGGSVGVATLAVGEGAAQHRLAFAALCALALVLGAVCFVGYRRLPIRFFHLLALLGTGMITAAIATSAPGAEPVYGIFYLWLVFLAFLVLRARAAFLQLLAAAIAYGVVLYVRDAPFAGTLLLTSVASLMTIGGIMAIVRSRLESMAAELASDAATDPVTELANRRGFDNRFALEVERARRTNRPLSLVICDLDRFKQVNDRLGHEEGDRALRGASAAIEHAIRSADTVARLGGEEFGVVLPDTPVGEAYRIAERMRAAIATAFDGYSFPLTASCGVACLGGEIDDSLQLFRAADAAMYASKRAGRDCTTTHAGGPAPLRDASAL